MSPLRRVAALRPSTRAYAGLCLASMAWASAFIFGKVVLAEISALSAGAWRHALAALVLFPIAWRARHRANLHAARIPLAVMIVCGGVFYPWTFLAALERTSATNTSLLIALNPALTFLLAPLVGERYTRHGLLGIALALIGASLVITHGDIAVLTSLSATRWGDLLALVAAALWATFNLASRGVVAHVPNALTNALVYGLGCLALFALASPQHPLQQIAHASPAAVGSLLAMVALSSVLAGQLFLYGVHTVGVGRTVVFVYIVPVLTAVASSLLLNEPLLPAQIVGGAAVLAGVYVATRTPAERKTHRAGGATFATSPASPTAEARDASAAVADRRAVR
jgi:drug/metabolite transporter (DMT)-like permease